METITHAQYIRKQPASVARILFAGFLGFFFTSKNKILSDAQIKEYNTKISITPNRFDESQHKTNASPKAPQLPSLHHNHPLSLVPRNFRSLTLTNFTSSRPNYIQSPNYHIVTQQSQSDDTYEQIIEQPHSKNFQSQNNQFFSPRWADKLDRFTAHFPIQPISETQFPSSFFCFPAT